MNGQSPKLRLDKWLWHARFFKSRTLAAHAVGGGKVRVNRQVVDKSHASVRPGDVLTFALGRHVRVIEVVDLGARRGPATEARTLYRDLDPPALAAAAAPPISGSRAKGSGRPTKTERRAVDRLKAVWRSLTAW